MGYKPTCAVQQLSVLVRALLLQMSGAAQLRSADHAAASLTCCKTDSYSLLC